LLPFKYMKKYYLLPVGESRKPEARLKESHSFRQLTYAIII
jgi:hypothetical protein